MKVMGNRLPEAWIQSPSLSGKKYHVNESKTWSSVFTGNELGGDSDIARNRGRSGETVSC